MVNTEEFTKRLKIIIDHYSISAAIMAEKMDVQRSSISHILSGRNKPSLDFVMKVLTAFPEVELYWLLNGTGTFPKGSNTSFKKPTPAPIQESEARTIPLPSVENNSLVVKNESDIERIVVFYKDGTFKNYTP